MKRTIAIFAAATLILSGAAPALAAPPCKDAKGKFVKCPPVKKGPCKDAKGKFTKCK